jgi:pimeloyl-ACP methyl ester carboxylesterase
MATTPAPTIEGRFGEQRFAKRRFGFLDAERLNRGYVIVLPGIEGRSWCYRSIVRGLIDADCDRGIEIHDWTAGPFLMLSNLRNRRRHRDQAQRIADKILHYQQDYPDRPVHLIGHSGGGAMVVKTLETLPQGTRVTGAVLLCAGISPRYPLAVAMNRLEQGLWNFHSCGDAFILGLLTTLCGTLDGRHGPAAGCCGFSQEAFLPASLPNPAAPTLTNVPYRATMARSWNFGGHFGCVNRRFIRDWIAPIIHGDGAMSLAATGGSARQ